MNQKIATRLLSVAFILSSVGAAQAIVIDDFSDGAIPQTAAPPPQQIDQGSLSGVIGSGDRRSLFFPSGGTGNVYLDVDSTTAGSALLTVDPTAAGNWIFVYGHNSPFDIDLTQSGGTAFVVDFSAAPLGTLAIGVIDTANPGNPEFHSTTIPAGPGSVSIPFSAYTYDLTHATEIIVSLTANIGDSFTVDAVATNAVPEPASILLLAVGVGGVLAYHRTRRIA